MRTPNCMYIWSRSRNTTAPFAGIGPWNLFVDTPEKGSMLRVLWGPNNHPNRKLVRTAESTYPSVWWIPAQTTNQWVQWIKVKIAKMIGKAIRNCARIRSISGMIRQKHRQIRVFSPTDLCAVPFLHWTHTPFGLYNILWYLAHPILYSRVTLNDFTWKWRL